MLLYLGAFLLVISALIFASSRDEALSGGWRVVLLAVYTAAFIAFGWLLRRWPRVREAGPVFLAIGALMTPLNFLLLYNEVLSEREVSAALVWFLGSSYSTAFYGFLFARGYGRLYGLPAAASLLSAWAALAVTVEVPFEWGGAWWLAFALGGIGVVGLVRRWSVVTSAPLAAIAALATLFAHAAPIYVEGPPEHRWQLPVTHALLLTMAVVVGGPRRPALTLVAATLLAVSTAWAGVWAAEWSLQWYNFPPLAAAAVVLATRPLWDGWSPWLPRAMSVLAAAGALSPFAFIVAHDEGDGWVAAAAFLASAALSGAIAWRNTTEGVFSGELAAPGRSREPSPTHPLERIGFGWLAFGSLLIAVGFAQRALGIDAPHTGWAYAVIGVAASAAMVVATRHAAALLWATLPALLLTTYVSLQPIGQFAGHDAVLLGVPAVHALVAFALLRRWSLAVTGVALGMLAPAALWESQAWQWWQLAGGYAAISVALFAVLTPLRRYGEPEGEEAETLVAAQALSWLPLVASVITAIAALDDRVAGVAIQAVTTVEYRALVLVVLPFAPLIAFDAWRYRRWEPGVLALAVLLGGVAALWPVAGWPTWSLAATFAAAGAGGFVALSHWRLAGTGSRELAVHVLSWLTPAAAVFAAQYALGDRVAGTDFEAVTTVEYRTLVVTVLLLAPLFAFEAWRFRRWELLAVAQVVLLGAVAAAWPVFDWPTWILATTFAAAGVPGFVLLARWRGSVDGPAGLAVQVLSWLPLAAAVFFAALALGARTGDTGIEAATTVEYRTLVLVVLLFAPLITFEAWRFRRWEPGVAALVVLLGGVAALWPVFDWPTWTLATTYALAGAGGFVALSPWRRMGGETPELAVQALSWLPLAAGVFTAVYALDARVWGADIEAATTVEYRTLVLVVLLLAPLITFEAWRFRRWEPGVVAQVVLLGAVAAAWPVFGWPTWTLAATFAAAGAGGFFALWRWRRIGRDSPELAVQALSWLPSAAAVLAAAVALDMRVGDTGIDAVTTVEYRTLVLVVLSVAPLIALEAWRLRRWEPGVAAAAVLAAAMAAWWPAFDWPLWTLAATYSLAGAGAFATLSRWRSAGSTSDAVAIQILSWGGLVLGPLTAMVVMDLRLDTLDAHPASLVEFRVLAVLFLPLAAAASFDGYRLGIRWAALPASALAMVALELAIATLQPGNVQAYTLPAALYLALVGLLARSSDELHPNLGWHEVTQLAGAGLLVIPQAEQGFDPGGARWGLVLLVEGLGLLAVAVVLNARWLGVSAVVTLSGVAMRFLWVNRQTDVVPYWVMLAIAGFFLLAVGVTVLLQRDWWDRSRTRLLRRWRQDAVLDARAPEAIPTVALFAALAPVLAILVVANMD